MERCAALSKPRKAPAAAGGAEAAIWPDQALELLLYTLTNDGSVRVRRKAISTLTVAVVGGSRCADRSNIFLFQTQKLQEHCYFYATCMP